jgi:predicted metal-dependent RNase
VTQDRLDKALVEESKRWKPKPATPATDGDARQAIAETWSAHLMTLPEYQSCPVPEFREFTFRYADAQIESLADKGFVIRRATPAAEPQRVKVVAMDSSNELGREYALVPATAPGMVTEDAIRSALVWGTDVLHGEQLDKAVQSVMAAIAAADPAPGEGE